jgi:hypothetical protein
MMKRLIYSILGLSLLLCACEKDGEKLTVKQPDAPAEFTASATDITLTTENAGSLVLTLYWTDTGGVEVSDPTVAIPSGLVSQTVQFSSTQDFASLTEVSVDTDVNTLQLTGDEVSKILMKLGLTDVKRYDVYVRLAIVLGSSANYSETLTLRITPFAVETGFMNIVDRYNTETVLAKLTAKSATPTLFEGFAVLTSGWYNCYFVAADGVQWGCNDSWTAYSLVPDSSNNCWFAEPSGCQYVYADTANELWWQVSVPTVTATVEGTDIELAYAKSAGGYSGTITTAAAGATVKVGGAGARYDITTGDKSSVDYAFSLVPSAEGTFEFVEGESDAVISVEKAGTYTLTFNVTDYTWSLSEGESGGDGGDEDPWPDDPDYVAATGELLYIYDADNDHNPTALSGKLLLGDSGYQGYFYFTAWYNFVFGDTADASTTRTYGSAPVDGGLYRLYCGSSKWNIWFDQDAAAYARVTVNMADRSWKYEKVTAISIVGDFNSWSLDADPMTFDETTKTYSADVTASSWGTYGIHFVVNSDWAWCFSDQNGDGVLDDVASDFMPSVEAGSYKITIDLNDPQNRTVKFE